MNQEAYLQRMRSIREKYGCQKSYQYLPKHNEVLYPLSQGRNQPRLIPNQHSSFSSHSPFHKEQHHFEFSSQDTSGQSILPERRCCSVDRSKLFPERQSPYKLDKKQKFLTSRQMSEAQLKRQDNFNHFIDDLDRRISEKEKLLNQKFKENQMILRKAEGLCPEQLKPYNIHSQNFENTKYSQDNYPSYTPNRAYEKSKSVKKKYDEAVENAENEAGAKLNWNRSPTQNKPRNHNLARETHQFMSTPSMDIVSKKLQANSIKVASNNWDPHKLESIQQRIQSVLKQSNR